ncbi:MAG: hypothetical protein WA425_15875, partial [Xanthobacteraceae bacterium]
MKPWTSAAGRVRWIRRTIIGRWRNATGLRFSGAAAEGLAGAISDFGADSSADGVAGVRTAKSPSALGLA